MSLVYNSNKFQYAVSQSLPFGELRRGFPFNAFNCMKAYSYNGERYGYYGYDASGERTYKYGLDRIDITTNQGDVYVTETYWEANEMMFYPNGYINMNQNGEYTKHYYADALRIASKIGSGKSGLDLCSEAMAIENAYPDYLTDRINIQYEEMKEELTELVPGSQDILDITPIPYPNFCDIGGGGQENDLFFYHPDHLGSTGVITDNNASITQGFLYAPFGELIYEHDLLWQYDRIPKYAFNAKELDEENGMYYYSARYYAPPTFISRDPMMEVKPWLSPYHYCSNSPLNRVDPTGMLDEKINVNLYDDPPKEKINTNVKTTQTPPKQDFNGVLGIIKYIWTGGNINGYSYNMEGEVTGVAPYTGMPPSIMGGPLNKGEKAIKLGKYLFNPKVLHSVKQIVLKTANPSKFAKIVGHNPDIMFKGGKIWLTGAKNSPFYGKSYETTMTIIDFLKLF